MTKRFEFLSALSSIVNIHDMDISSKTKSYCQLAIKQMLTECLKEIGGDEVPTTQEVVTDLPVEQPKKRGRKPKKEEIEEPLKELPSDTEDVTDTPVEEWEDDSLNILVPDGEHGLDPRIGRLSLPIIKVTTEDCIRSGVSPLIVANSVSKTGVHPFFKAPLSYISYLPIDRMTHYMANALEYQDFENFTDYCDPDAQKEEWEKVGIDIKFVTTIIDGDRDNVILRPASKVVNESGVAEKIKAAGGFKKIVEPLGEDGEKLVKFMARYGINQQLLVDILTIVKKHSENPNPYI